MPDEPVNDVLNFDGISDAITDTSGKPRDASAEEAAAVKDAMDAEAKEQAKDVAEPADADADSTKDTAADADKDADKDVSKDVPKDDADTSTDTQDDTQDDDILLIDKDTKSDISKTAADDAAAPTDEEDGTRDYTIFKDLIPGVEESTFKRTPNAVFNVLKDKIVPELRQLRQQTQELTQQNTELTKGAPPQSFYAHPEAYTLAPEYKNVSQELQSANYELSTYEIAMQQVANGAKRITVYSGTDENGNAVHTPIDVSDTSRETVKIKLQQAMSKVHAFTQQKEVDLKSMERTYTQRNDNIKQFVDTVIDKKLSMYKGDDNPRANDIKSFVNNMPAEVRGERLMPLAARLYAAVLDLVTVNKQLRSGTNNASKLQADRKAAGPGSSGKTATKKSAGEKMIKFSDDLEDIQII